MNTLNVWLHLRGAFASLLFAAISAPAVASDYAPAAEHLAKLVQAFVERDEIVGAEVLVVHQGQTLLHRAFGLADRETATPLAIGSTFAVRSMTKPFTGLAAQMLIEEGVLALDAPVSNYLPSFARDATATITVRQLLTHRSGLPLALDLQRPLSEVSGGLLELAELAAARGPAQSPGERFLYSDAGSDVLGAVVASVAGRSLEQVIQERILGPLQLRDIFPEAEAVTPGRRHRVPVRYGGVAGSWTRLWGADEAPMYPFLKGSGGLFATVSDYARFLTAWTGEGGGRSLPSVAVRNRALAPASREVFSTGFPGLVADYGQLWTLYRKIGDEAGPLVAFGHGGSDGTHAYAFPQHGLVVCYFTQTRGHLTTARFEEALGHLFLQPNESAFARLLAPVETGRWLEYVGLYARENRINALAAVIEIEGALAFEVPGRQIMRLRPTDDPDRWVSERAPNDSVVFQREEGRVTGLALNRGGRMEQASRFRPNPSLPTVDELVALRAQASPPGVFAALRPLRVHAMLKQGEATFPVVTTMDREGRVFTEVDLGPAGNLRFWIAGEKVWRALPGKPAVELRGLERSEELNGTWAMLEGDWRLNFREVTVLAREMFDGRHVYRVRTVPREGLASTKLVDVDEGSVRAEYGFTVVPGAGLQGRVIHHADHREFAGLRVASRQEISIPGAPKNAGTATIAIMQIETEIELPSGALDVPGL